MTRMMSTFWTPDVQPTPQRNGTSYINLIFPYNNCILSWHYGETLEEFFQLHITPSFFPPAFLAIFILADVIWDVCSNLSNLSQDLMTPCHFCFGLSTYSTYCKTINWYPLSLNFILSLFDINYHTVVSAMLSINFISSRTIFFVSSID